MADNNTQPQAELPLATRLKLCWVALARHLYTRSDGSINRRLYNLLDIKTPAPATKLINTTTISTADIPIDPSRNLWFRLFTPATPSHKSLPFILYFHGGGFSSYGPDSTTFDNLCTHLAARVPAVVASVNYRLAPEHKHPAQYEDALDALQFMDAKASAILPPNTDLSRCFIGGDSAGGNITHHLTEKALQNGEQFHRVRIAGVVEVQPFFGGEERTESELRLRAAPMINVKRTDLMWRNFLAEGADRNHPAAHVFGGEAAAVEFPSTVVIVGGNDPLQDWQRRYVEWLSRCGKKVELIEYPNAFHGFYAFPELPEFGLLIDNVVDFVNRHANSN